MPFTPFHFGPGGVIKTALPNRFSFTTFVMSQIVTDLEVAGAIIVGLACGLAAPRLHAMLFWRRPLGRLKLFVLPHLNFSTALISAWIGTVSHVFLDSLMHGDMAPFWPLSTDNPMQRLLSRDLLHAICIVSGIVAAIWAGGRIGREAAGD